MAQPTNASDQMPIDNSVPFILQPTIEHHQHRTSSAMSISSRREAIRDLKYLSILSLCLDDENLLLAAVDTYREVEANRFLNERIYQSRGCHYFLEVFPCLPETEFIQMFRTTRMGFTSIRDLIKDHPVFQNNSRCKQADPTYQLAVAMARLGSNGNGASVSKMQAQFQLGCGTVTKYTERVLKALLDMRSHWISWPVEARRKEISQVMGAEGFPGCVGFIDGTTIPLSQKPALDGQVYFDRKKR